MNTDIQLFYFRAFGLALDSSTSLNMVNLNTDKCTSIQLFYFRAFGLWPPEHPILRMIYQIYGFIFHCIFSLAYTVFMVINVFILEDMTKITDALYMSLTEVALLVKTMNFFIRAKIMQDMLAQIQSFHLETDEERKLIKDKLKFFLRISIYYYGVAYLGIYSSFYGAAVSKEVRLPYQGWYPLDWQHNNISYWITFAYQSIGMIITCNINITIELFPMFLMFMTSVQMEILGGRLQAIGHDCEKIQAVRPGNGQEETVMMPFTVVQRKSLQVLIKSIKTHRDCTM